MNASDAPCVTVAGLSARLVAQSASRAGFDVVALDIFGDRDTREHASMWFDIGAGNDKGLTIDRARLYDALERAARVPRMLGLIVSGGMEALVREVSRAPGVPPLIGNGAQAEAVRDPRRFFAMLDAAGIAHPEVSLAMPDDPAGWLVKRVDGCGGTHVEWAAHRNHAYFQRFAHGVPMSALFVAAHREAAVIGFAEQLTIEAGPYPFVHAGSLGPVDLPANVAARIVDAINVIVRKTDLMGLNSIDFLLDGDTFSVLEINTRPSSTMALYEAAWPDAWPRGLIGAHVDACLQGDLPRTLHAPPRRAGQRVVFAPKSFTVPRAFSDACFDNPRCHDVPLALARIETGQPVCTVSATAATFDAMRNELEREHARILQCIEEIE